MQIHNEIEQGSPEWHALRLGRVGGSESASLLTEPRSKADKEAGKVSQAFMTLVYKKAAEQLVGQEQPNYESFAMQRGSLLENEAREVYELETGNRVIQVGYITSGNLFGVSPDGLIGNDGALEIKCPLAPEFLRFKQTRLCKSEHHAQIQWLLWITGRKWCDYVVYHPQLGIEIQRYERDEKTIAIFDMAVVKYETLITQLL